VNVCCIGPVELVISAKIDKVILSVKILSARSVFVDSIMILWSALGSVERATVIGA